MQRKFWSSKDSQEAAEVPYLVVLHKRGEVAVEGGGVGCRGCQAGRRLVSDVGQLRPEEGNGAPQLDEAGHNAGMRS